MNVTCSTTNEDDVLKHTLLNQFYATHCSTNFMPEARNSLVLDKTLGLHGKPFVFLSNIEML